TRPRPEPNRSNDPEGAADPGWGVPNETTGVGAPAQEPLISGNEMSPSRPPTTEPPCQLAPTCSPPRTPLGSKPLTTKLGNLPLKNGSLRLLEALWAPP